MDIVVAATDEQWDELTSSRPGINWLRLDDASSFKDGDKVGAFFSLKDQNILPGFAALCKPVFVHAVTETLSGMQAPANVVRINGWPTFLKRNVWELAVNGSQQELDENIRTIFNLLNTRAQLVKDEPGFVSARVIAMIINEGFFAVQDKVSSRSEIDTAMKLGTNYPLGPFEWASLIGLHHVAALLKKLSTTDSRYVPADLLMQEANQPGS